MLKKQLFRWLMIGILAIGEWPQFAMSAPAYFINSAEELDCPASFKGCQPNPEGGWDGLASWLNKLKPSTDTRPPLSAAQFSTYLENLINQGRAKQALSLIERQMKKQQMVSSTYRGKDVQLQFQQARALTALNRLTEAKAVYIEMTTLYPELPEPWNNLAILYVQANKLELATHALNMALRAYPDFNEAQANLKDVKDKIAQDQASFHKNKIKR